MRITKVKVYLAKAAGRLKAYAVIVLEDCFIVRDLKIIEGDKGLFVSMPSRRRGDKFKDIAHPVNSQTRTLIEDIVIGEYKKVVEEEVF